MFVTVYAVKLPIQNTITSYKLSPQNRDRISSGLYHTIQPIQQINSIEKDVMCYEQYWHGFGLTHCSLLTYKMIKLSRIRSKIYEIGIRIVSDPMT